MNIYLLQLVGKWFSLVFISTMSFFNFGNYSEESVSLANTNNTKDLNIVSNLVDYSTKVVYNSKMPYNLSKVVTEGVYGITYNETNEGSSTVKVLQEPVTEVIEKGTGAYGLFVGKLTGYSADCGAGCSGEGNLACKTEVGTKFSIKYNGIYYTDDEYGKVRILSAATAFPCGTIVKVTKAGKEPYYAVVMDRGGTMNKQWANGVVHMDLAYESNALSGSDGLTGSNINFSVQRWGW